MIRKLIRYSIFLGCMGHVSTVVPSHSAVLYLELIKKALINSIYEDPGASPTINPLLIKFDHYSAEERLTGRDWPSLAHTMVGLKRLDNIHYCAEEVIKNNVKGDFIETGVWRGGSTILMRAVLKAYNITDRRVWVADSFAGLPAPNLALYPADGSLRLDHLRYLSVSLEVVKNNFQKYDLLDNQVVFLKGWFKDTIPNATIKEIALLRLDGDMYESTINVLDHLYPKVSVGGYIIVDDYMLPACKKAIHDYRKKYKITDPIIDIDGFGAYWKKTQ